MRHPDPQQVARLRQYAVADVNITAALAVTLPPQITRPAVELPILIHTIRLFTERGEDVSRSGSPLSAEKSGRAQPRAENTP